MEIGSLVKCVEKSGWEQYPLLLERCGISNIITPVVNKLYIIRGFYGEGNSVYLEEIVNKLLVGPNVEPSFNRNIFVEMLPPMDISEMLKELMSKKKIDVVHPSIIPPNLYDND